MSQPIVPADPIGLVEAATPATPPAVSEEAAPEPASVEAALTDDGVPAPPAADAAPEAVPTVDIKNVTDDTICRKERPTGSLIGVTRCYSRSAASLKDDDIMRRDIEEMRMRQNDQQAREAAAAMSRRRVAP